jgi:predicted RNA-binding Zn-ribbon protein involved in translation (DUF1610 family)
MFFIGIMGLDSKEERLRRVSVECPNCSEPQMSLLHSYNRFHFFFLPLFKWEHNYHLHCETCSSLYQISQEKGRDASIGNHVQFTYWDLSTINQTRVCKSCKRTLEGEFEYCPYCGNKQF